LLEGLTYEEEDLIFETNSKLFSIGTIIIPEKIVSLLNIGMLEIRIKKNLNHNKRHQKKE
jgi:hypothetical protein